MLAFRNGWYGLVGLVMVAMALGVSSMADEPKAGGLNAAKLRTATVTRGTLAVTVNATGTVEPKEVVDVGSQVAGRIASLGADPHSKGKSVDFGSRVEEGTLLAQIEDAAYVAQVEQADAACNRANAELTQAKAKLALATVEWQRAQEHAKNKSISTSDLDVAMCTYQVALASAAIAQANVVQSRAALKQAKINLDGTRIRSPVQGVIIDRRVNVGQGVGAALNSPSLFLIAKDLKNLQVWASVNEADIGRIHKEQAVRFTVDAFPNESFGGKVDQIRLNATMTQNVVTYTVVIAADNSNEKLLPYLTANVRFEIERRNDVLLVPNAALRWRPQPQWVAPQARQTIRQRQARPKVWVLDGEFVRPITVQVGPTDGVMTEISGDDVKEGMEIVVGGGLAATDVGQEPIMSPTLISQFVRLLFTRSATRKAIQQTLARMGTNQVLVQSGGATSGGVTLGSGTATLTPEDADAIGRQCPAVADVAPIVRARAQVAYGDRNWVPIFIHGTSPSFLAVRDWEELAEGAAFTDADVRNGSKVCLIGETLKRELFQGDSPIGKEIRIQNVPFRVLGVLNYKGPNIVGLDQDDIVLAPWTTIKFRITGTAAGKGSSGIYGPPVSLGPFPSVTEGADASQPMRLVHVDQILTKAASAEEIPDAIGEITELLRQRHRIRPGQDNDFNLRDMTEITKAALRW